MSSIFISHSSKDNEIAQDLARRLAEQHHPSVFLDLDPEKGILAGQSWERTLYRKLRACHVVIALCTDHYLSSYWCFAEIALARMEGKLIIALQVDPLSPDTPMPGILTERQFIDLRTNEEVGYRRLWAGLKEEDVLGVAGEWDPNEPPYLGLSAFQERHAPVFFGREEETRSGLELLDRGAPDLVMVLGASGSGKSSLVRAGILPRLRRETGDWLVIDPFRPGQDPFAELAGALETTFRRYASGPLARAGSWEGIRDRLVSAEESLSRPVKTGAMGEGPEDEPPPEGDDRARRLIRQLKALRDPSRAPGRDRFQEFLEWSLEDLRRIAGEPRDEAGAAAGARAGTTALIDLSTNLRRLAADRQNARVLLIIDQFEELLGHEAPEHLSNRFLDFLRASLEADESPLMALGTMRSDFLGVFQRNPALRGLDFESLSVGSMKAEGMRRVIEGPAKLGTLELEPGLADRLLADAETPDALPLLSFTLWKLWKDYRQDGKFRIAEYDQLGGLQGTVANEADAVLAIARREGKERALRGAFLRMARVTEDGKYARQPVSRDEPEIQRVETILDHLVERRLLVSRMQGETRTLEVAHEALFRSWAPLASWLDDHRGELMLKEQVRRDAALWDEGHRKADALWRGGRLQQAKEIMKERGLPGLESEFVRAGIRGRQRRLWTLVGTTILVFAVLASAALLAHRAKKSALDLARVAVAKQLIAENKPTYAALVLLEVEKPDSTRLATRTMVQVLDGELAEKEFLHAARVESASFSPDGSLIATASWDRSARVWSVTTGEPVTGPLTHEGELLSASFSPDGSRLVTAGRDTKARVWDVSTGKLLLELGEHLGEVKSATFSPDGSRLVTLSVDTKARVWNAVTGERVLEPLEHEGVALSAAFGPDGSRLLVTTSVDTKARVWNVATGKLVLEPLVHEGPVVAVAFNQDGSRLVTASAAQANGAVLWDADTGDALARPPIDGETWSAAFDPQGTRFVTASADGTGRVWDAPTGEAVTEPLRHKGDVWTARFDRGGTRVVTASADGTARVWDAYSGEPVGDRLKHGGQVVSEASGQQEKTVVTGDVVSASFSPDGARVVTASADGSARLWNTAVPDRLEEPGFPLTAAFVENGAWVVNALPDGGTRIWKATTGEVVTRSVKHDEEVGYARFSCDGSRLLTVASDGSARIWETQTGEFMSELEGRQEDLRSATFSPDGSRVVTVAYESATANIWNAETGGRVGARLEHGGEVSSASFSPDGSRVLTASIDGSARIWDASSGAEVAERLEHDGGVNGASFSPDGSRIVTAAADGTARIWSAEDGSLIQELAPRHSDQVLSATFSPDGSRLITTSMDTTARVWDVTDGSALTTPLEHAGWPLSASFSPDGSRVVTASQDGKARVWDARTGEPITDSLENSASLASSFGPEGSRVVVASNDGGARIWPISGRLLQQAIRARTAICLPPVFRQQRLGESHADALSRHRSCEQGNGRRSLTSPGPSF